MCIRDRVDGDLSDWAGVTFIEPRFEASDGRETGKGNAEIDGTTYSTFAEFGGGTWSGPDDHTTSIAVAWDHKGLYLGIVVTDDEHEHAAGNAWNGDGVQMGLTDPERATVTHLYNYCIRDGYESGKVYKNGDAGIIADKERGPGNYSVAMVRDDAAKTTTYEALFAPDSFGFEQFEIGQQFGFGVCVNDGDAATPGQKGWSGWGPHMIVFGKTAPDAALVTLTGLEVLDSFSEDFNGEDGEHSELITLEGTAAHTEGELRITEAANSQNGGALLEDFTDGAAFSNFEMSFRLFMGNGTARPADGFSVSIDNDLPNLASPAEEGAGNGLKICFDAWDSGGGDLAPQIEVFYGGESQAMQSFTGETDVPEADRFADEDGNLVTLWDNDEWADVKISVIGGLLSLDFRGHSVFADKVISSGVFEGPSWLFAARTGGANQKHYIDDLNITIYSAGGPLVTGFTGGPGGFDIAITDAEDNGVVLDTLEVKFDGEAVEAAKSKTDGVTSVKYSLDTPLAAGSEHTAELSYADEKGNLKTLPLSFKVGNYVTIDPSAIADSSLKGESGFIANITQISTEQTGGANNLHGNQIVNAEKQINGEYIDPNTEEAYLNEADPDSFEGWSYFPVIVETVNQNQDAPGEVGNFRASNDREDEEIPGIPGWGGSTDGIAGEYIALLDLEKGSYTLGVNSDDGFHATIGANFGDLGAQSIGSFNGGRGASDTIFEIYVQEAGLYPFRVLWFEGGGGANVEIFSVVPGAGKTLINDPDVEGSIQAYTIKGATVDESTTDRVDTGRAVLVSVGPQGSLVKSSSIDVIAKNGSKTSIDQGSIAMTLNGEAVTPKVSKDGDLVNISLAPEGGLPVGAHTVEVTMKESNGSVKTATWSFAVPGIYTLKGDVPTEAEGFITVREYHGIGTTSIATLMAQAKFPDSPDVNTVATYFEWPQSGDIDTPPPGNVRDNYGWHLVGYIHPPETGEYRFFVATDDNSELWLSTDADPANAVQVTQESQWRGVRNYGDEDESNSAPIFLEKGKAYFIECFAKEGGGGDNMAVAWSLPSDEGEPPANGSNPISGEYLSPFVSVIDPEPTPLLTGNSPKGAFAIGEGGDIEVTFLNRGLDLVDVSVTVNGAEVASKVTVDGKVSSITASPGDVKGTVEVAVSYNGETLEWSYLTYEPLDPDGPNPVAFWNFDGTTEDWAFGAMGELRNGAVFTDDSYEGQALDLTDGGNQHMHVANASALNIAASIDEVTITFWQKLNSTPNTSSFWAFSPTASSGGRAMQAHAPWSNGNIYWDTAGCCNGGTQRINADATDNQVWEEWNHYAFVKSGSYKAIYVNGELFHDGDNTAPLPTDITYLNVGGDQNGNNSVRGAIDDFAIFAATLDDDQIYAIYEGDRSLYPKEPTYPTLGSAGPSGIVRSSNVTISATLNERGEAVADAQLLLNGTAVDHKTSKDGNAVTVSYSLEAPVGAHDVQLNWNGRSHKWSFSVAGVYTQGAAPGSAEGLTVLEYHDIGTTSIPTLQSQAKYPDSPDFQGVAKYFEWPQSGDIAVNPAGNVRDNYGWLFLGYIHPPETGDYVFHVATDDNSELWLSTDENPANAVKIAQESTWHGVRGYAPEGEEETSAPVTLEKGKAYFVELVVKEGGGGDNAAVAWRLADEGDVAGGALPIAGEHLSQWLIDGDATPPSVSVARNADGTVTVTFEGTLQTAPTVNGPWTDVDGESPLTLNPDQAAAFGRAKK